MNRCSPSSSNLVNVSCLENKDGLRTIYMILNIQNKVFKLIQKKVHMQRTSPPDYKISVLREFLYRIRKLGSSPSEALALLACYCILSVDASDLGIISVKRAEQNNPFLSIIYLELSDYQDKNEKTLFCQKATKSLPCQWNFDRHDLQNENTHLKNKLNVSCLENKDGKRTIYMILYNNTPYLKCAIVNCTEFLNKVIANPKLILIQLTICMQLQTNIARCFNTRKHNIRHLISPH
ncbi:hypothetical protein H8356DRAFT_1435179 [Neocallimastix lanati (nom. inval.)]|nr:hypothetical protein H8356DRAFT_1435179 [Neocallimastix sp. JGI-2020a]